MNKFYFTSESVTEGHPDKLCDMVSDAILDDYLKRDQHARVACETFTTANFICVMGEITSNANVNIEETVRNVIRTIGYTKEEYEFTDRCELLIKLHNQSPDIAQGVDTGGAGDQGIMFGYACNETYEYMPLGIVLAHNLAKRLKDARKSGELPYLRPDGKTQVTVEYEDGKPKRVDAVVVSAQHDADVDYEVLKKDIMERVIKPTVTHGLLDEHTKYYINPTGKFVIGGPAGDTGLTGRKIIVDTYGGHAAHGGGCFSGKDPTKVDRSASYMARFLAKNVVANGYADRCEIQLSYAIGKAEPLSVYIDTFGTEKISKEDILEKIKRVDLTPNGIINKFNLRSPIYLQTACYGHFGRLDLDLPWEKIEVM